MYNGLRGNIEDCFVGSSKTLKDAPNKRNAFSRIKIRFYYNYLPAEDLSPPRGGNYKSGRFQPAV